MELLRWTPFGELDSFERRMRRMFSEFGVMPSPLPAADVYEAEGEFVVELEVPGFSEDELTVETTDHVLHVAGKREEMKEEQKKSFALRERLEASFERSFTLPPEVDTTKLEADFAKGVLKIHAPKVGPAESRPIPIVTPH